MAHKEYQVEFNGHHYVVLEGHQELAAFDSCVEAYNAKRDFETKSFPLNWEKTPPAMRMAKRMFYGELA